ncbi:MAG: hypothetical protein RL516_1915 [Bacteroidota bacterium]
MSKTQRFRRLFLLLLIFWGIAGGLVSLHTCLDNSDSIQSVNSCCCDEGHIAIKDVSQSDCCKTVTCYVGIPLYFLDNSNTLSFFDSCSLINASYFSLLFEGFSLTFLTIHPPPESQFPTGNGKRILAMRI